MNNSTDSNPFQPHYYYIAACQATAGIVIVIVLSRFIVKMCKNNYTSLDLTPKPPTPWSWHSLFSFKCWRQPAAASVEASASAELIARNEELQTTIRELTERNTELEANVATLTEEKAELETKLENEKTKKKEAKKRRSTFKSKIADMSAKLKEDFGEDYESKNSSSEGDVDIDMTIVTESDTSFASTKKSK